MTRTTDHPLRKNLHDEVHARPYAVLTAPERASHLALVNQRGHDEAAHLAELCSRFGAALPPPGATHFAADFGTFRIKWERHTEFFTYTFFVAGSHGDPFSAPAIQMVPQEWLAAFEAQVLVAIDVAFEPAAAGERSAADMTAYFVGHKVLGSRVSGGCARVWTDFQLQPNGASRFLIDDSGLTPGQAGRLVQRLLEIETYRMMALLALPLAREVGGRLDDMETALAAAAEATKSVEGADEERALLGRLTALSAEVEAISSRTSYRFGAAQAYYEIVRRRIEHLRESRIEDLQTIGDFMARRLAPAMRTCSSVHQRQEAIAERISRATAVLRTRVDLALEEQNRDLLASMDRRAKLQLRLQQTVEGLSTAAITYYLASLVGYLAHGAADAGAEIGVDLVRALSVPVIAILVWQGVRRVRRHVAAPG